MQSTNSIIGTRPFIRGGFSSLRPLSFLQGRSVSLTSASLPTTLVQNTLRSSALCKRRLSIMGRPPENFGNNTILVRSIGSLSLGFAGLHFLSSKSKEALPLNFKGINWSDSISIRKTFKGNLEAYEKAFIQAVKEDDALMQVGLVIAYWEAIWDKDHLKDESAFANKRLRKFLGLTDWEYYGYINLYEKCFPNSANEDLESKAKEIYKRAASLGFLPAKMFHILSQVRIDKGCDPKDVTLKDMAEIKKLAEEGDPEAQFYHGKFLFEEAHKFRNKIEANKQKMKGLLLMYHSGYLEICPMKKNLLGDYNWRIDDDGRSVYYGYEEAVFLSSGVLICKENWLKKHLNLN